MTGLMMPLILPTTTSGVSAFAAAAPVASASATTMFVSSNASRPRMEPLDRLELASDRLDVIPQPRNRGFVSRIFGDGADDLRNPLHVVFVRAASRHGWRAESNTTRHRGLAGFARHRRHARDDACTLERARQG